MESLEECLKLNGGIVITPEGVYYSIEHRRIANTPIFRLNIVGTYDIRSNEISMLTKAECRRVEKRMPTKSGSEIEFIAQNATHFEINSEDSWNKWNGLQAGTHHNQIYAYLLKKVEEEQPKNVLVLGCGTGELLDLLKRKRIESYGIDSNEQNVHEALRKSRHVEKKRIQDLSINEEFDMVIDAGVMTGGVIDPKDTARCLDASTNAVRSGGMFMQIPYTRSLLTSFDLEDRGFLVHQKTEPRNLFTLDYPKQMYMAEKE